VINNVKCVMSHPFTHFVAFYLISRKIYIDRVAINKQFISLQFFKKSSQRTNIFPSLIDTYFIINVRLKIFLAMKIHVIFLVMLDASVSEGHAASILISP